MLKKSQILFTMYSIVLISGVVLSSIAVLYLIEPIRLAITMAQYQVHVDMNTVTIDGLGYYQYLARAGILLTLGLILTAIASALLWKRLRQ